MYEIHYKVQTSDGKKREHTVKVQRYEEYAKLLKQCEKFGYEVMYNPMCRNCAKLNVDCDGERSYVYTGCVYRREV